MYIKSVPQGSPPPISEYLHVARARSEVMETMKEWISAGGGAQDILDDLQLLHAMQAFLNGATDHSVPESPNYNDASVQQAWQSLSETHQSLSRVFQSCTMRPTSSGHAPMSKATLSINESRVRNLSTREPPDIDRLDAEELVDNLDGMACAAFSNVTEEVNAR